MTKIAIGIGGSSGSIYAKVLLDKLVTLQDQLEAVGVVMSDNAKFNWEYELGEKSYENYPFQFYGKRDFMAPFASGSAQYGVVIICPCSMGLLGRIANGISEGHGLGMLVNFIALFAVIWWAWMNFTWFASAYDVDDVPYRLLVFVQMTGALIFAAVYILLNLLADILSILANPRLRYPK